MTWLHARLVRTAWRESAQTVNAPEFFVVDVSKKLVSERGNGSAAEPARSTMSTSVWPAYACWHGWCGELGGSIVESNGKLSYSVVGDRMIVRPLEPASSQR